LEADGVRPGLIYARPVRLLSLGLTVVFLVLWAGALVIYIAQGDMIYNGSDYRLYMDATQRWLAGGSFYQPYQLAGPYTVAHGDILYPPTALPLFVVFTFLPAFLWWAVPIGGTIAMIIYHRPAAIALAGIAFCLWFPATSPKLLNGNPVMWVVLATALGTKWAAAAPWALIKPSLFPFALVHVNRRAWWVSLAVMGLVAVLLWPMMLDWISVIRNGAGSGGLLYSAQEIPMVMIPILAWVGSSRSAAGLTGAPSSITSSRTA
jgi:hypothetical protein